MQALFGPEFKEAQCQVSEIGAKAYNLFEMHEAGIKVPPFFCLTADGVEELLQGCKNELNPWSAALVAGDLSKMAALSESLQTKIRGLVVPSQWLEDIENRINAHFHPQSGLAIRSSGALEDLAGASFAGQYDSYLYVQSQDLEATILNCIASAFSIGMAHYRHKMALTDGDFRFAVIFQEMVASQKSGVAFSADQTANLADALIVAGYGLGEGVVSNQVETDTYWLNRQNLNFSADYGFKERSLDFDTRVNSLKLFSIDQELREKPVLNRKELEAVFAQLLKVESLLKAPADIEFAFNKQGALWLLQMRPITGLDPQKLRILDNTNIVESYPGISKSLTFSLARKAYEHVFASCAKDFWIPSSKKAQLKPVFRELIAHFEGRIYYRLDNWYQLIDLVFKSKKSREAWQNAVGLKDAQGRRVADFWSLIKMVFASIWMLLRHRARVQSFFTRFEEIESDLNTICAANLKPPDLWRAYEEAVNSLFSIWSVTIVNDFLAFKFYGFLQNKLRSLGFKEPEALAHKLCTQFESIESEQAVLHLLEIKDAIIEDPELRAIFNEDPKNIEKALKPYLELREKIEFHREKYGDRVLAELKLEVPSLQQEPLAIFQLLKSQLKSTMSREMHQHRKQALRAEAWRELRLKMSRYSFSFILIRRLSLWAGKGLRNRENMRFARARGYGRMKRIFAQLSTHMKKAGVISEASDIFYLDLSDLERFCAQSEKTNLREKVHLRKQEEIQWRQLNPPDRIAYLDGEQPRYRKAKGEANNNTDLVGLAVSKGTIEAEVVIVEEPSFELDLEGKILVSKMTDPGWVFLMTQAAGIISEKGSVLSHTAIVGRELGVPTVVGVSNATQILKTGQRVLLDANEGRVIV